MTNKIEELRKIGVVERDITGSYWVPKQHRGKVKKTLPGPCYRDRKLPVRRFADNCERRPLTQLFRMLRRIGRRYSSLSHRIYRAAGSNVAPAEARALSQLRFLGRSIVIELERRGVLHDKLTIVPNSTPEVANA